MTRKMIGKRPGHIILYNIPTNQARHDPLHTALFDLLFLVLSFQNALQLTSKCVVKVLPSSILYIIMMLVQ